MNSNDKYIDIRQPLGSKEVYSQRVRKVAEVINLFTREEIVQLVSIVPRLREIQVIPELPEYVSAVEYFRDELLVRRGGEALVHDKAFIGGLTYGEYLALSEEEEIAFWDRLFAEDEMEVDNFEEHDVKPDARVPAQQKRGP
ncbi:hypothetical protein FJZ31_15520 [Candidatus Poribacteria bacterium]|nr:hypothetical protein [Candidatus Poribacteria bacterium]